MGAGGSTTGQATGPQEYVQPAVGLKHVDEYPEAQVFKFEV